MRDSRLVQMGLASASPDPTQSCHRAPRGGVRPIWDGDMKGYQAHALLSCQGGPVCMGSVLPSGAYAAEKRYTFGDAGVGVSLHGRGLGSAGSASSCSGRTGGTRMMTQSRWDHHKPSWVAFPPQCTRKGWFSSWGKSRHVQPFGQEPAPRPGSRGREVVLVSSRQQPSVPRGAQAQPQLPSQGQCTRQP